MQPNKAASYPGLQVPCGIRMEKLFKLIVFKSAFFNLLLHFEVEKFPHPVVYVSVIPIDVS